MSDLRLRLVDIRGIRDAPTSEPLRGAYGRLANAYLEIANGPLERPHRPATRRCYPNSDAVLALVDALRPPPN